MGCLQFYVADRWWGQSVYWSWGPSLTKDMQAKRELIRVNELLPIIQRQITKNLCDRGKLRSDLNSSDVVRKSNFIYLT